MDKESIVDVLTADTDVFFACWDTDNGWQVLTNGNASFPAALFAQKGIEALRDVVAESDSRLCDNFCKKLTVAWKAIITKTSLKEIVIQYICIY